MEYPRQEYWSGKQLPTPGGLPHPGIEPRSPVLQADSLPNLLEMCIYEPSPRHTKLETPEWGVQQLCLKMPPREFQCTLKLENL